MKTSIIFLRGINVSGQKKIKMVNLKTSLEKSGFVNVRTYIQSGNILIDSREISLNAISESIQTSILNDFGFDVPVLVASKDTIRSILKKYPFKDAEDKNQYFTLLYSKPDTVLIEDFNSLKFENEDYQINEDCVYLNCKKGAGKAKLNTNLVEKKLQIIATTRNLRTMQKMLKLA